MLTRGERGAHPARQNDKPRKAMVCSTLRASRDAAAQQVQGHLYGEGTDALAIAEELPV